MSDRKEKLAHYRRSYWQRFKQSGNKRVYGSLSKTEWEDASARAQENGRGLFLDIWLQAEAYRQVRFVPTREIERRIEKLYQELRRIGTNINQIAKVANARQWEKPARTGRDLMELEDAIAAFCARPWLLDNKIESSKDDSKKP